MTASLCARPSSARAASCHCTPTRAALERYPPRALCPGAAGEDLSSSMAAHRPRCACIASSCACPRAWHPRRAHHEGHACTISDTLRRQDRSRPVRS
jgi:hypothetical protein